VGQIKHLQNQFKVQLDRNTKIVTTLSQAWSALNLAEPVDNPRESERVASRRRDVLRRLEMVAEWIPSNRHVAIFRGRLHVLLKEIDKALEVLDKTLSKRVEEKLNNDEDHADLLFNKACYLNSKAKSPSMGKGDAEFLRTEAWETITESIRIKPENYKEATTDEDLDGLTDGKTRQWEAFKPRS
jgi:hypothetical protein